MPNWCFNQVEIKGDEKEIQKAIELIESSRTEKEGEFKLLSIISPMPPHIEATLNGPIASEFNLEVEPTDWYFWRLKYWGTKWDVDNLSYNSSDKNSLTLTFFTAWNPSLKAFITMSMSALNLQFTYRYYELGNRFVGTAKFMGGWPLHHQHDEANKETMKQHGFETNYFEEDV